MNKFSHALKLLLGKTGNKIVASIDEKELYHEQSLFSFSLSYNFFDLKIILAILNSKVGNYLLNNTFSKKDAFPQIRLHWLKEFPVKSKIDNPVKLQLLELADTIFELKKELSKEKLQTKIENLKMKVDYCENKINQVFF